MDWTRETAIRNIYPSITTTRNSKTYDDSGLEVEINEILVAAEITRITNLSTITAEISRLESLKNSRMISDAILGKSVNRPGHPDHGKSGGQRLTDLEALLDIERAKLT